MLISAAATAQNASSAGPAITLRVGAFFATPLVEDAVSSSGLDATIPGPRSHDITLQQQIGPMGTLAVRFPMRTRTSIEVSGSVGRSTLRGDDGLDTWDAMPVTIGSVALGFGYFYRNIVTLHGGVGLTKLFAEERGLFAKGNGIRPMLEAGAASGVKWGSRPFELALTVQSHSFGTATLRDNGGSAGNVTRAIVQVGTTLWQGGRP